ncbi:MAG: hypothetical protein AMS15_01410 [Planctomycetes bacterium DG_23]|nr:MAG: hypothetical protein AMS15_01410 [Planctomycetes bacterium DG_23]
MKRKIVLLWVVSIFSLSFFTPLQAQTTPPEEPEEPFSLLEELAKPKYRFSRQKRGQMRRDPFRPPAELVPVKERPAIAKEAREKIYTAEQERLLVAAAEKMVEEMRRRLAAKDYKGVKVLQEKLTPLLATGFYDLEANRRITTVRKQVEKISADLVYYDTLQVFQQMRESFYEGEYEAAGKLYEELLQAAERQEDPKPLKIIILLQAASLLANRAAIRLEFLSKEIPISFIAWTPEIPYAIVEDRVVGAGDVISPDLEVYRIEKQRIVFRYKGEVMARSMID